MLAILLNGETEDERITMGDLAWINGVILGFSLEIKGLET